MARSPQRLSIELSGAVALLTLTVLGCQAERYVEEADRDVAAILKDKQWSAFGRVTPFSIEDDRERLRYVLLRELDEARRRETASIEQSFGEQSARLSSDALSGPRWSSDLELVQDQDETAGAGGQDQESGEGAGDATQDDPEETGEQDERLGMDFEETLRDIERRYAALLVAPKPTEDSPLGLRTVSLVDCLQIAAANSRDYQRQKETVYLTALDLTLQRYQFELQYGVSSSYDWTSAPGSDGRRRDGDLRTNFSLSRLLASGGLLVFDFTNSLLKTFTGVQVGSDSRDFGSSLGVSFTQPLLRGFGREIVQEPLIQAEREVVYSLRSFERFRREFALQIASSYYGLVEQLDSIKNAYRNYLQVISSKEQSEALADKGRRSQVDTDRARQSELNARDSWIRSVLNFEDSLDRFKITLGLPIEANLAIDPGELSRLEAAGLAEIAILERDGIDIALRHRLDFLNDVDFLADSERQIAIAEDQLRTGLDLNGSYSVSTKRDTALDFRGGDAVWSAGVQVDLPLDLLRERNTYRRTLISYEQAKRAFSLAEDQIKVDVRQALRRLAQLRESHAIQVQSVEVAERRVEATHIEVRMGRAQVLDALDATDDLNRSKNQLTSSLVDYELEVLGLYLTLGLLRVTEDGFEFASPNESEAE